MMVKILDATDKGEVPWPYTRRAIKRKLLLDIGMERTSELVGALRIDAGDAKVFERYWPYCGGTGRNLAALVLTKNLF